MKTAEPKTIQTIVDERLVRIEEAVDALQKLQVVPPSGVASVAKIVPPRVLSILCWNIQVFNEGKALDNPYVNKVMRAVVDALSADVVVMLETRERSYSNLNGVEFEIAQGDGWLPADDGAEDIDDSDEKPLSPEELAAQGAGELTFTQLASEQTGKHFEPPKVIFAHDEDVRVWSQALVDVAFLERVAAKEKKAKKLTKKEVSQRTAAQKREAKAAQMYAAARNAGSQPWARDYQFFPKTKALAELLKYELVGNYYALSAIDVPLPGVALPRRVQKLELRKCQGKGCGKSLGAGNCPQCIGGGPYTTNLQNLQGILAASVHPLREPQTESYSVLLRPDRGVELPSNNGVYLDQKFAVVHRGSANLLMRAAVSGGSPVAGTTLGYQDHKVAFYGRCPFLIPLEVLPPGGHEYLQVPVVVFHGPFGESTKAGIEARAAAIEEVLKAQVEVSMRSSSGVQRVSGPLGQLPNGIIMGDFNLDYDPNDGSSSGQKIAADLYQRMQAKGFIPQLEGVRTSLVSIHDKKAKWTTYGDDVGDYTSSAYDNLFVHGPVGTIARASAIDVIDYIREHIADFPLPAGDKEEAKFAKLTAQQKAFYVYHRFVSDHLPIICDILVQSMSPEQAAALTKAGRALVASPLREVVQRHEGTYADLKQLAEPTQNFRVLKADSWLVAGRVAFVDEKARSFRVLVVDERNPALVVQHQFVVAPAGEKEALPKELKVGLFVQCTFTPRKVSGKSEQPKTREELLPGRVVENVPGDGNCLFHAVAGALGELCGRLIQQHPAEHGVAPFEGLFAHGALRTAAVTFLNENQLMRTQFGINEAYLLEMAQVATNAQQLGRWGSDAEINALARTTLLRRGGQRIPVSIRVWSNIYPDGSLTYGDGAYTIDLYHGGMNHWQWVRPPA